MTGLRVVLFAGSATSRPARILAYRINALAPHAVLAGVVVVSPFSRSRARELYRRYRHELPSRIRAELWQKRESRFDEEMSVYRQALAEAGDPRLSLREICNRRGIPCRSVSSLAAPTVVKAVRSAQADIGVFAGGGIVRASLLDALPAGMLNNHSGPLPLIRGMNAVEWSLLTDNPITATIHLMDRGVDTGPILESREVPLEPGDSIPRLRARTVLAGIDLMMIILSKNPRTLPHRPNPKADGRQYYVMADSLRARAADALARRVSTDR